MAAKPTAYAGPSPQSYANQMRGTETPPHSPFSLGGSSTGQPKKSGLSESNAVDQEERNTYIVSPPSEVLALPSISSFKLPNNNFCKYLIGTWKRNLEWREFGYSFRHLRTSNTLLVIEEYVDKDLPQDPNVKYLKWSFGKTLDKNDLRFGYVMKFITQPKGADTILEWNFSGTECNGRFIASSKVATFNFPFPASTVLSTYRIQDADTLAVCIIEVDDNQLPTIQYGNMFRIDPALYLQQQTQQSQQQQSKDPMAS